MWQAAKRFWLQVDVRDVQGCWQWQGWCTKKGYGRFWPGVDSSSQVAIAHRVAYQLARGLIPAGLYVLHSCDNRRCCNPTHLRLGTQADNMRDMVERGRSHSPKGEVNGRAKLTALQVLDIRRRRARGETGRSVAQYYGVTAVVVSDVARGESWQHVGGERTRSHTRHNNRCSSTSTSG